MSVKFRCRCVNVLVLALATSTFFLENADLKHLYVHTNKLHHKNQYLSITKIWNTSDWIIEKKLQIVEVSQLFTYGPFYFPCLIRYSFPWSDWTFCGHTFDLNSQADYHQHLWVWWSSFHHWRIFIFNTVNFSLQVEVAIWKSSKSILHRKLQDMSVFDCLCTMYMYYCCLWICFSAIYTIKASHFSNDKTSRFVSFRLDWILSTRQWRTR